MRILIVGSDANAYTLAKKMSQLDQVDLVFVAPGNNKIKKFATSIGISIHHTEELIDFVKANEVNLTVVVDEEALKNSISNEFEAQGLNIFAPTLESSRIVINKSSSKKTLYKLRVQTPKFGIFDKENMAIEYARKSKYPLVIKNDLHIHNEKPVICYTFPKAKNAIEQFFDDFNKKIVIEEYVDAREVSFYVITDGYTALPIGKVCSRNLKDEVVETDFETKIVNISFSPDNTVSKELESKLMTRVVYPVIDEISKHSSPYSGILGIDLLVNGNNFQVIEFNSFFKSIHMQSLVPLVESNLYDLILAAVMGSLSDDYNEVVISDNSAVSLEIKDLNIQKEILEEFEDIDISYSRAQNPIITVKASTLNNAKLRLVEFLKSNGFKNESDIKQICSLGESKL